MIAYGTKVCIRRGATVHCSQRFYVWPKLDDVSDEINVNTVFTVNGQAGAGWLKLVAFRFGLLIHGKYNDTLRKSMEEHAFGYGCIAASECDLVPADCYANETVCDIVKAI